MSLQPTGTASWLFHDTYIAWPVRRLNWGIMPIDSFNNLPRATEELTLSDAYRAMIRVLEYYHELGTDYEVGAILGDLSAGVWADGSPGDPAAWSLWLESVDKIEKDKTHEG